MLLHSSNRHRPKVRRSRDKAVSPAIEGLEERKLLYATSGGDWTYGSRITYSFMPDGTSIGGLPSVLFQTMNAKFSQVAWQQQVEKAAAAWEAVANINLALVPDDGSPVGTYGYQQNDPRFGDIRIGGFAQSPYQLAFTFSPPPFNGGTVAGDVFFNTSQLWQINGNTFDLETAAIHEIGHALGMSHSAISTAVMYAYYTGTKQALTSDDAAGLQSIYGAPLPDVFDSLASNNNFPTASWITPFLGSNGQLALGGMDITGSNDPDWYFITAPSTTTGTMTVTVQSSNLSSLSPAVFVYNSVPQFLGRTLASNTFGGTATYSVAGVAAGQSFYIKVVGADLGASGQGGYGLLVNFGSQPQSPIPPPWTYVLPQPDQGGGGTSLDVLGQGAGPGNSDAGHASAEAHGGGQDHGDALGWGDSSSDDGDSGIITVGTLAGWGDHLAIASLGNPLGAAPAGSVNVTHVQAGDPLGISPADPVFVPLVLGSTGAPSFVANLAPVSQNHSSHGTDLAAAVDQVLQDWL